MCGLYTAISVAGLAWSLPCKPADMVVVAGREPHSWGPQTVSRIRRPKALHQTYLSGHCGNRLCAPCRQAADRPSDQAPPYAGPNQNLRCTVRQATDSRVRPAGGRMLFVWDVLRRVCDQVARPLVLFLPEAEQLLCSSYERLDAFQHFFGPPGGGGRGARGGKPVLPLVLLGGCRLSEEAADLANR